MADTRRSTHRGPDVASRPSFIVQLAMRLYRLVAWLAGPALFTFWALSPAKRPMCARFSRVRLHLETRPIWIHAVSVGEVELARTMVDALSDRWPEMPVLITSSTPTGMDRAKSMFDQRAVYAPVEWPPSVRRFFRSVRPRALILIETELWPLVLDEARRANVPVAIVNARLSDRSLGRYRRLRWFFRPLLEQVDCVAAQSDEYARRFAEIGIADERIAVTGNLKFDNVLPNRNPENRVQQRARLGIPPKALVVAFGSTRPGDEAMAVACWNTLSPRYPSLQFIVAPRHLERVEDVLDALQGLPLRQRSADSSPDGDDESEPILVLDTHGELREAYAAGDIAVIGGSFSEDVQGHNPIEPAAQGVLTVFGPCMRNFADVAEALLHHDGAVQLTSRDELAETLAHYLDRPDARQTIAKAGAAAVRGQTGAAVRTLDALGDILG